MTLWQLNPPEPCGNHTTPLIIGDTEATTGSRRCGLCPCVPPVWKLTMPEIYPRAGVEPVYYLQRNNYRFGPTNNVPAQCSWTDTGLSGLASHSNVNFELVYDPAHDSLQGDNYLPQWFLLDWAGDTGGVLEPPTHILNLFQPADDGGSSVLGTLGSFAYFNCLGTNRFQPDGSAGEPGAPTCIIEPFYE